MIDTKELRRLAQAATPHVGHACKYQDAHWLREGHVDFENADLFIASERPQEDAAFYAAARPPKPTECMNGCPDRQVCDHCQWPPGPDQRPAAVDEAMVERFLEAFQNTPGDEAIGADEKVARRWLTAALATAEQQPTEGEEIMVNTPQGVFTLPLHPSGLSSGPRFVVHVPELQRESVTVRYDLSPAQTESAIRDALIRMGWTPPTVSKEVSND